MQIQYRRLVILWATITYEVYQTFFCLVKSSLGTRLTVQWDKALTCSSKGGWAYSLCIPFIRPSLEVGWLIRLHYINNTELATGLIRQCVLHVYLKPSVVVWSQAVSRARPMARPTWVLLARLEIKWGEISYLPFWELVLMAWSRKAQGAGNPMLLATHEHAIDVLNFKVL